jgi:hypothetical protein
LFGTTESRFEHVHKVVLAYMTFITKMLYGVDQEEFKEASRDKHSFFKLISNAISFKMRKEL